MQTWTKRGLQTALVTSGLLVLGTGIASANENVNPDRPASAIDGGGMAPPHISNDTLGTTVSRVATRTVARTVGSDGTATELVGGADTVEGLSSAVAPARPEPQSAPVSGYLVRSEDNKFALDLPVDKPDTGVPGAGTPTDATALTPAVIQELGVAGVLPVAEEPESLTNSTPGGVHGTATDPGGTMTSSDDWGVLSGDLDKLPLIDKTGSPERAVQTNGTDPDEYGDAEEYDSQSAPEPDANVYRVPFDLLGSVVERGTTAVTPVVDQHSTPEDVPTVDRQRLGSLDGADSLLRADQVPGLGDLLAVPGLRRVAPGTPMSPMDLQQTQVFPAITDLPGELGAPVASGVPVSSVLQSAPVGRAAGPAWLPGDSTGSDVTGVLPFRAVPPESDLEQTTVLPVIRNGPMVQAPSTRPPSTLAPSNRPPSTLAPSTLAPSTRPGPRYTRVDPIRAIPDVPLAGRPPERRHTGAGLQVPAPQLPVARRVTSQLPAAQLPAPQLPFGTQSTRNQAHPSDARSAQLPSATWGVPAPKARLASAALPSIPDLPPVPTLPAMPPLPSRGAVAPGTAVHGVTPQDLPSVPGVASPSVSAPSLFTPALPSVPVVSSANSTVQGDAVQGDAVQGDARPQYVPAGSTQQLMAKLRGLIGELENAGDGGQLHPMNVSAPQMSDAAAVLRDLLDQELGDIQPPAV